VSAEASLGGAGFKRGVLAIGRMGDTIGALISTAAGRRGEIRGAARGEVHARSGRAVFEAGPRAHLAKCCWGLVSTTGVCHPALVDHTHFVEVLV
jgi:hypothetical protein